MYLCLALQRIQIAAPAATIAPMIVTAPQRGPVSSASVVFFGASVGVASDPVSPEGSERFSCVLADGAASIGAGVSVGAGVGVSVGTGVGVA